MQEDIYRGDGLNLYAYCANNPVMYYDPSGYNGILQCNGAQFAENQEDGYKVSDERRTHILDGDLGAWDKSPRRCIGKLKIERIHRKYA